MPACSPILAVPPATFVPVVPPEEPLPLPELHAAAIRALAATAATAARRSFLRRRNMYSFLHETRARYRIAARISRHHACGPSGSRDSERCADDGFADGVRSLNQRRQLCGRRPGATVGAISRNRPGRMTGTLPT